MPRDLHRCRLRASGGLFDKLCDGFRLRYIDGVAALDLNDRSTSPLGHLTLGIRWDHLVVAGEQVPARLGPPRRFADLAAKGRHPHGTWESAMNAAFSASTPPAKEGSCRITSRPLAGIPPCVSIRGGSDTSVSCPTGERTRSIFRLSFASVRRKYFLRRCVGTWVSGFIL